MSRRPASEPYWSVGVYRFDATEPEREDAFGVCYAASSLTLAFAESVIHGTGRFAGGRYEVPREELAGRSVVDSSTRVARPIILADLTGEALKALGLNNDISATDDYTIPQAWARAIHDAAPRWEGIRYVSRQMNKGYAYALFERSGLCKLRAEKLGGARCSTSFAIASTSPRSETAGAERWSAVSGRRRQDSKVPFQFSAADFRPSPIGQKVLSIAACRTSATRP